MNYPLDDARKEITSSLETVLAKLNYDCEVKLEMPREHVGDFAFPCFSLAPIAKKAPKAIAEDITKKIEKSAWIENVEANNGYVNFFVNTKHLAVSTLQLILEIPWPGFSRLLVTMLKHSSILMIWENKSPFLLGESTI